MTTQESYLQAVLSRDPRFDGKFFVGVKTTGIYCRPICPAKPKPQNIEFFANSLAAEKAGYRPCLRCRPEAAPMSPAWVGTSAVVQRALKVIHNQEALMFNEDQFASTFGVTARHLRRLFIEEIGKTPKQIFFENRLNLSRKLITETALPLSEVAFASGFKSIRRFNDAFKMRFKKSPTSIRRNKTLANSPLRVSLAYRPPFDYYGLLSFYRSHQIGNLEWFTDHEMFRVHIHKGKIGVISISNDSSKNCLNVEIDFPDSSQIHSIILRIRNMFDLDSDPILIANQLETYPKFKKILKKHPGLRLPSGWDGFEVSISTILGQLVSVERAQALLSDLIEIAGTDTGLMINGKKIKAFPSPEQVLASNLDTLKTTSARKNTLKSFSKSLLDGHISLEPTQDVESFVEKVQSIKGIGAWSSTYIAMKALRHTDSFPATDLILARALDLHPKEIIDQMSPWRAYVAMLLWKEYSKTLSKNKKVKAK